MTDQYFFNENNEQKILNINNTCNVWSWYNLPINLFDDQYIVYLGSWIIPIRICNPRKAFISSIVVSTHPWATLWAAYRLVMSTRTCTKARGILAWKTAKDSHRKAAGVSVLKIQQTPERQCLPQPRSKNRHPWCRLPGCQGQTMLTRYPDQHRCPYHFQRNDHYQNHSDQSLTQNQRTLKKLIKSLPESLSEDE